MPRSVETTVNLLVDGEVVRTTTGPNSERLDWSAWNLRDLVGETAQIQLVDRNTGGWGHLLADHFTFADEPALSVLQRSSWMDYGKDFYAAVTWNDVPDRRRIAIAWMSNWNYAGADPHLALAQRHDRAARARAPYDRRPSAARAAPGARAAIAACLAVRRRHHRKIMEGSATLPVRGKTLEIKATLRLDDAERAGLKVRTGGGEETVIGYDAEASELYVDRTRSGGRTSVATSRVSSAPRCRPPRQGKTAHPGRLVLSRGLRRPRPNRHHRPDLPRRHQRRGRAVR